MPQICRPRTVFIAMWRLNYTHTSYTMENPFFAETSQNTQDIIQIAAIQKFRPTLKQFLKLLMDRPVL